MMRLFLALLFAFSLDAAAQVRLYTLDCGHATFTDMGFLSDTGEYEGKPGAVAVPCFLVRHPSGNLLWDTGLGDTLADAKGGVDDNGIHMTVPATLAGQLKAIGLAASDIKYVAFSHMHFDHTGNANQFGASTWILNRFELAWALGGPPPFGVNPDTFSAYKTAKTKMIEGDEDVFGDGTVRILKAPGHTPGHQVLLVRLNKSGPVVLSGDLYHQRENRKYRRVPTFNTERADTLASMDRIERIVKNNKARFVVQHDERDFRALPRFPAYLE